MSVWSRPLVVASALLLVLMGALPVLAAQAVTSSYESPTYGFEVSWDTEIWTADEDAVLVASGPEAIDRLVLQHGGGTLSVVAGQYGYGDAASCVSAESAALADERGVSEYLPLRFASGEELAGVEGEIAFGGFELLFTPSDGAPLPMVNFIECRLLPESAASLVFTLVTTPDQFEQQMAAAGAVNASLRLAQPDDAEVTPEAEATPEAEVTPEAETATTPVDAEWFAAQVAAATAGSPLAGPLDGELVQTLGSTALVVPPVEAESFYLRVRFQNPSAAADAPWDIGVAFREQPSGEHYRLVIDSFGDWYLSLGVEEDVQRGQVTALDPEADGVNSLELVAAGDIGAFRLNGEIIGPLDLSARSGPGQISVGTAFFAEDTTDGAVTRYRDLAIWPLAVETPAAAAPPEAEPTVEPTAEVPAETPAPTATSEPEPEPTLEPTVTPIPEAPATATPMPAATVAADQVVIRLRPVNDSGAEGLAVLYPDEGRTTILLTLLEVGVDQIGAIHAGTCSSFDPLPSYALAAFDEAGRGTSTINVELSELRGTPLVILLHQGTAEFGTVVACGEIPPV